MSDLEWSNDYIINIPAIDNEHKLIVSIVNDISRSMLHHGELQAKMVSESLRMLSRCIRNHFESEERLLSLNNYPELEAHMAEHAGLLTIFDTFEQNFTARNSTVNEEMLLFLKDWFVRHILLHDSKIGHYYSKHELSNHSG
jgi:hemerythrin-like metal-binding protein